MVALSSIVVSIRIPLRRRAGSTSNVHGYEYYPWPRVSGYEYGYYPVPKNLSGYGYYPLVYARGYDLKDLVEEKGLDATEPGCTFTLPPAEARCASTLPPAADSSRVARPCEAHTKHSLPLGNLDFTVVVPVVNWRAGRNVFIPRALALYLPTHRTAHCTITRAHLPTLWCLPLIIRCTPTYTPFRGRLRPTGVYTCQATLPPAAALRSRSTAF
eukprot:1195197-Prorocentrum_minimum.AAC.3